MDALERDFIKRIGEAAAEYTQQLKALEHAHRTAIQQIQKLVDQFRLPSVRRLVHQHQLGYRIPDWVWEVMEHQRRTEGSGNGRVMRD